MRKIMSCVFFILLFTNTRAQSGDTLVVYEHVIVYDTIKVYDTVVVYDTVDINNKTFFSDNNYPHNATLIVDTATKEAGLKIFFQKDTATIPINSTTLSETNTNLDTMKKEIIAIVTAALLTQSSVVLSQADSTHTNTISNGNTSQAAEERPFVVETVLFKKKDSDKQYEVSLPTANGVWFKSEKLRKQYTKTPAIWFAQPGQYIITHIDTSCVKMKFRPPMKRKAAKEFSKAVKQIQLDKSLSEVEKENKYFLLAYPDSAAIPISAIRSIRFSRFNNKNKRFYCSTFKTGFNESIKHGRGFKCYRQWASVSIQCLYAKCCGLWRTIHLPCFCGGCCCNNCDKSGYKLFRPYERC